MVERLFDGVFHATSACCDSAFPGLSCIPRPLCSRAILDLPSGLCNELQGTKLWVVATTGSREEGEEEVVDGAYVRRVFYPKRLYIRVGRTDAPLLYVSLGLFWSGISALRA